MIGLVGCIAGAVLVTETERLLRAVGLTAICLTPKPGYVAAMQSWNDPLYAQIVKALPAGTRPADYLTSLDIAARKRSRARPPTRRQPR